MYTIIYIFYMLDLCNITRKWQRSCWAVQCIHLVATDLFVITTTVVCTQSGRSKTVVWWWKCWERNEELLLLTVLVIQLHQKRRFAFDALTYMLVQYQQNILSAPV